jgi:DNA repair exonuclease SbcCD ATPase subunit
MKRDLIDSLYSKSENILICQHFSNNSNGRLIQGFESNRDARRQRSLRITESARRQAVAKLSEIERLEAEISELVEREAQLKKELESSSDDRSLRDCKLQLMDVRAKSLTLQQELHESVLAELQLRFENEVMRLRRDAADRISELRANQDEVRNKFRALQDEWNSAQKNEEEFREADELARLDRLFGELAAEIETVAREEARSKTEVTEREIEEIHRMGTGVKKWAADVHAMALAAHARCLAFEKQGQKDEEVRQRDVATAALDDLLKRLRELDGMLGGLRRDVELEERFQSIRERVVVVLDEQETQMSSV